MRIGGQKLIVFFNLVNLIESGGSPFNHSLNVERDEFGSGKGKYLLKHLPTRLELEVANLIRIVPGMDNSRTVAKNCR